MGKVEPANVHPGEDEFGEFLDRAGDGTDCADDRRVARLARLAIDVQQALVVQRARRRLGSSLKHQY